MKNLFLFCLFIVLGGFPAMAQQLLPLDSVAAMLHFELGSKNYDKAKHYVAEIVGRNEPIAFITVLDCAEYFYQTQDYEGCIKFCDNWSTNHEKDKGFAPHLLYNMYGECYRNLGNYKLAVEYMDKYTASLNGNLKDFVPADLYTYANSLHKNYQLSKADTVYNILIHRMLTDEGITAEGIKDHPNKELFGIAFYEWAYNRIFQADERLGLKLLRAAALCGNKNAQEDYDLLSKSSTFDKTHNFKNGTLAKFDSYIAKLQKREISFESKQKFWDDVQNTDEKYLELKAAMNKLNQPKTLSRAFAELDEGYLNTQSFLTSLSPYDIGNIEPRLENGICGDKSFFKELRIYPSSEPNAFATPYGHVYLTDGLIFRFHKNMDLISAVCAHEAAHYVCQHTLIKAWQQGKREKRNKIMSGLVIGLNTAAIAGSSLYAASQGVDVTGGNSEDFANSVMTMTYGIDNAFKKNTYLFKYKYSRMQEIEADLIAYRYCESIGLGGYAYILALELLGSSGYLRAAAEDDHPTTTYRISVLKRLYFSENYYPQELNLDFLAAFE